MDRTRKRDGRTDGQCDYHMPPKVPLGHKKMDTLIKSGPRRQDF